VPAVCCRRAELLQKELEWMAKATAQTAQTAVGQKVDYWSL
jgi:hypothetical protein